MFNKLNILTFKRCLVASFSFLNAGCFLSLTVAVMEFTNLRSNGLMFSSSLSMSSDSERCFLVVDCLLRSNHLLRKQHYAVLMTYLSVL